MSITLKNGTPAFGVGTYNGTEDTYISETNPFAAPGKFSEIQVGYNNGGKLRGLIRFDLSILKPAINENTIIKRARLKLYLGNIFQGNGALNWAKAINVHQLTPENVSWSAGNLRSVTDSATNTSCWQYRLWNNNRMPPQTGEPQHVLWAGQSAGLTGGTDYVALPVATASLSEAKTLYYVDFDFNDPSFLKSWISDQSKNAGFVLIAPELESTGTATNFGAIRFASSDSSLNVRPELEIVIENFNNQNLGAISYNFGSSGNISMIICNQKGEIVRQLLAGAPRGGGQNYEPWDCKRDPVHLSDTLNLTVPDGQYTVKTLQTQGLRAEYLLNLGYKDPSWKQWPGSHVAGNGIALDSSGIIIGSGGSEGAPGMIKIAYDGTYNWASGSGWPLDFWSGSCAMQVVNDTLYAIKINGTIQRFTYTSNGPTAIGGIWETGFTGGSYFSYDMSIAKGKIAACDPKAKMFCWMNSTDGLVDTMFSVPGIMAVAMDSTGNALVAAGNKILRYSFSKFTPEVVIDNLNAPVRISVNKSNGDIYVVEGDTGTITWSADPRHMPIGATWQIKRFSAGGELLGTFGEKGGRDMRRGGKWEKQKHSFFWIGNIVAANDGSFYITECMAPRRLAHFSKEGAFIEEWLLPSQCDVHASANPNDPTEVWYNTYLGYLLKAKVDYANKKYTLDGYYNYGTSVLTELPWGADNSVWNVMSRNGKTYLYYSTYPAVLMYDESGDSLKPIAAGARHYELDTSTAWKKFPAGSFTWADMDGDGQPQAGELIVCPPVGGYLYGDVASGTADMQATWTNFMDTSFNYYGILNFNHQDIADAYTKNVRMKMGENYSPYAWGPAVMKPKKINKVGDAEIPVFDWNDVQWPTEGFPASKGYDTSTSASGLIRAWQTRGYARDDRQNVFQIINYEAVMPWQEFTPEYYGNTAVKNGGNYIIKYDSTGKRLWMSGKHALGSTPAAGEIVDLSGILGTAHGCLIARDYFSYQYVYDEDGLYAGRLLENPVDEQKGQDATVGRILSESLSAGWGEQFAGSAFEVKNDLTPGLKKGDVIWFGFGVNDVRVVKITGWENFKKATSIITVADGRITGQSDVNKISKQSKSVVNKNCFSLTNRNGINSISFLLT